MRSGADGQYAFTELRPGQYTLSQEKRNGYIQTYPVGENAVQTVNLSSGDIVENINFGSSMPSSIRGVVFNDFNANGIRDGDDGGITQWVVRLSGGATRTQLTNQSGQFEFLNLPPGNYIVKEDQQDTWLQTSPQSPGVYSIVLFGNVVDSGKNFGNFKFGIISGKKFNDVNGNGDRKSTRLNSSHRT